ncbi:hypothetical protein ARMGADRAFT_79332 [Armillaria gallica]|uniref:Uncharacterized protein n=1 Tax=Armillaria gallica TaxID=47427 RepID=A0A2H3CG64_ARMGA|nr:hypothetical protein ARMGADRAFT_79332 [Armillaria gallica]
MTGPKIVIRRMPYSEPFSSYHYGPWLFPQSLRLACLHTDDFPVCRPKNVVLTLSHPCNTAYSCRREKLVSDLGLLSCLCDGLSRQGWASGAVAVRMNCRYTRAGSIEQEGPQGSAMLADPPGSLKCTTARQLYFDSQLPRSHFSHYCLGSACATKDHRSCLQPVISRSLSVRVQHRIIFVRRILLRTKGVLEGGGVESDIDSCSPKNCR